MTRHAEYLLDTTVAPVIADLIRNPEGHGPVILALRQYPQGGAYNKPTPTDRIPSPLMGEESKVRVKASQHQHTVIPA